MLVKPYTDADFYAVLKSRCGPVTATPCWLGDSDDPERDLDAFRASQIKPVTREGKYGDSILELVGEFTTTNYPGDSAYFYYAGRTYGICRAVMKQFLDTYPHLPIQASRNRDRLAQIFEYNFPRLFTINDQSLTRGVTCIYKRGKTCHHGTCSYVSGVHVYYGEFKGTAEDFRSPASVKSARSS